MTGAVIVFCLAALGVWYLAEWGSTTIEREESEDDL